METGVENQVLGTGNILCYWSVIASRLSLDKTRQSIFLRIHTVIPNSSLVAQFYLSFPHSTLMFLTTTTTKTVYGYVYSSLLVDTVYLAVYPQSSFTITSGLSLPTTRILRIKLILSVLRIYPIKGALSESEFESFLTYFLCVALLLSGYAVRLTYFCFYSVLAFFPSFKCVLNI